MDTHPIPSAGAADAANARWKASQNTWITTTQLAAELGVHPRTLARWSGDHAPNNSEPGTRGDANRAQKYVMLRG